MIGVVLDNAREAVMKGQRLGIDADIILVSEDALRELALVKAYETSRGIELRMLGKPVLADRALSGEDVSTRLLHPAAVIRGTAAAP